MWKTLEEAPIDDETPSFPRSGEVNQTTGITPSSLTVTEDQYDPFDITHDNDTERTSEIQITRYAICLETEYDPTLTIIPDTFHCTYNYNEVIRLPTVPTFEEYIANLKKVKMQYQKRRYIAYRKRKREEAAGIPRSPTNDDYKVNIVKSFGGTVERTFPNPIFDCGCTAHMWNHRAHFTTYMPYTHSNLKASLVDGFGLDVLGKGDIGPLKMYSM